MAPMILHSTIRPARAVAIALGLACALAASAFAQGLPTERDLGPAPVDVEAGSGPPVETDTPAANEQEVARSSPPGESGLKIPRFASLRSGEVNVRTGPGTRYPVEWVFVKRGLPVEITAEFGAWRRIRDGQGAEGWVHRSMLSGKRTVVVTAPTDTLRRRASADAPAVARAEQGVLASVRSCRDNWCEIEAQGFEGWVPETSLWGVYPNEVIR
jgi:SH3-like domain-containing protein